MSETSKKKLDAEGRPLEFAMAIHTGMLESLGLNMYTSIGKSLAEFVANAHDADSNEVNITVPFAEIEDARRELRQKAKAEVVAKTRDAFTMLYEPLPDAIKITIKDDGHGMSAADFEAKFLAINRNRRVDTNMTESGARYAMGRKGLGKLAGFGAAEKIEINSTREGETYITKLAMDFNVMKQAESINQVKLQPTYASAAASEHYTEIILSALRCDALKAQESTVAQTLAQMFSIIGDGFKVSLNGNRLVEEQSDYEFSFPEHLEPDGFAKETVSVEGIASYDIRYVVKFRAREGDKINDGTENARGSLPARLRGARIYCNNRLAHGPSLLDLETGMHNFHAQSYMVCIVHADELDRHKIDHIGTNRAELKRDNDIVEALFDKVTDLMRQSLIKHSKFRDDKAEKLLEEDPYSKVMMDIIGTLSKRTQTPARKMLKVLAASVGTKGEMFKELAPLMLKSINAGEVLTNLIGLKVDPKSIMVVAHELAELGKIEVSDVLKLYRGRRDGILALQALERKSNDQWKGAAFEKELHALLKANPWLIKPEFSRWLTSDENMDVVAKKMDKKLKVDTGVTGKPIKGNDRPDLVFALADSQLPTDVVIVELKSPGIPLNNEHLSQLEGYITQAQSIVENDYNMQARVHGYLIGTLAEVEKANVSELTLMRKMKESGPESKWQVIPLTDLLMRARKTHLDAIVALEEEEKHLDEEL